MRLQRASLEVMQSSQPAYGTCGQYDGVQTVNQARMVQPETSSRQELSEMSASLKKLFPSLFFFIHCNIAYMMLKLKDAAFW